MGTFWKSLIPVGLVVFTVMIGLVVLKNENYPAFDKYTNLNSSNFVSKTQQWSNFLSENDDSNVRYIGSYLLECDLYESGSEGYSLISKKTGECGIALIKLESMEDLSSYWAPLKAPYSRNPNFPLGYTSIPFEKYPMIHVFEANLSDSQWVRLLLHEGVQVVQYIEQGYRCDEECFLNRLHESFVVSLNFLKVELSKEGIGLDGLTPENYKSMFSEASDREIGAISVDIVIYQEYKSGNLMQYLKDSFFIDTN